MTQRYRDHYSFCTQAGDSHESQRALDCQPGRTLSVRTVTASPRLLLPDTHLASAATTAGPVFPGATRDSPHAQYL